jgi:hypothetical protein
VTTSTIKFSDKMMDSKKDGTRLALDCLPPNFL